MNDKMILKKIVKRQVSNRSRQYISLKFLTIILCLFLTAISVILFNEMRVLSDGEDFKYILIGLIILVFLYFISFYSIAYLNFYREQDNYKVLINCGLTEKELKKSMKYFGRYLTGKNLLVSGVAGIGVGIIITWKYKSFSSVIVGLLLIMILSFCVRVALWLCMKKMLKSFQVKRVIKKKNGKEKSEKLNIFTLARKYLIYNAKRTFFINIVFLFSGILLSFAFSMNKSIDLEKYIVDNWGDQNYQIILNKEGDTTGEYHLLQINNPLTESFREDLLKVDGIERIVPEYSMEMSFKGDNEVIETSICGVNEAILAKSKQNSLNGNEVIIGINESLEEGIKQTIKKDKIVGTLFDGRTEKSVELKIVDVIVDNSKGIMLYAKSDSILEMAENSPILSFYVYGTENEKVEDNIKQLIKGEHLELESKRVYEKETKSGLQVLAVGIFSILIILILFAVTTSLNIKFMNIISRKTDFKALETIGMNYSDIKKMLIVEDWSCNIPILIIAGIAGNVLSFIVCEKMDKIGATFMLFKASISGTVWCIVLFIIISVAGMKMYDVMKRLNN